ncbi:MAG: ABC transporter ATP-binding protein [Theionarchaea archaeon]|nr:ABC transporter ATP-binding protein [Theionarchaea archaeon]MBU7001623.1 ABC transporter ATP-binding protein [Theionarchaea archaeon]MBU7021058.1 ABC transporter ATP-binding protein [Theionarchaea archaeon]MBU7035912.1 ABC transporter ATP-binding protein [Theionarchaea archaeon]MBU7041732.1 ABC transporter ATP-binding protein [Theionarchaea archaeon]
MLTLEKVSKTYNVGEMQVEALKDVSLTVNEADFISIMGPSGSGKSTLLHLMGALDVPSSGHVCLEGKDLSTLKESELTVIRRTQIGFVFQAFNVVPQLTALENVELPLRPHRLPTSEKQKRAEELLEKVGLSARMNHLPRQLSGGEIQRVAVARALVNRPKIVLADEPTGELDSKTSLQLVELMKKMKEETHTAFVIVTHDFALGKKAERKLELIDGTLKEKGD